MKNKNLQNEYYSIIYLHWINHCSYSTIMNDIDEYGSKLAQNKGIPIDGNRIFIRKFQNDFKRGLLNFLYSLMKSRFESFRERGTVSIERMRRLLRTYCWLELRDKLNDLLDDWEFEDSLNFLSLEQTDLKYLSQDTQNVHTAAVSKQTNTVLSIIKDSTVPKGQRTLDEIANYWIQTIPESIDYISLVYDDMKQWGNTKTVIRENDWEYRNVLRGIWAKIKTYEDSIRLELIKRLWEECYESVGMCAQGHLSRLTNVLVGFDETVKPVISKMESFQDHISDIYMKDISLQEKIDQTIQLMDEIQMPEDQRTSWLEAIE